MITEQVGNRIRYLRNQMGLSQEKLAFSIGADRTYISALELGNKIASVYCLYNLSQALEVDLKDLFDFEIK